MFQASLQVAAFIAPAGFGNHTAGWLQDNHDKTINCILILSFTNEIYKNK